MKALKYIFAIILSAFIISCEKLVFDFSQTDSKILFLSQRDEISGELNLYIMNSDGSSQEKITDLSVRCEKPVVSHSGKTILFGHYTEDFFYELYLIGIDGSNLTLIDKASRYCGSPDWSKDDTKIIYLKNRNESTDDKDIILFDIIANTKDTLTESGDNTFARFSPDNQIVYCQQSIDDTIYVFMPYEIYLMNFDGSDKQLIIRRACHPVWSPGGNKIAYISCGDESSSPQIFTANSNGSDSKQLTYNYLPTWDSGFPSFGNYNPQWTQDGKRIVYESEINDGLPEIYIMNSDGSDQKRLTDTDRRNDNPEITSDGKFILFSSNRILDMNTEIFVMNINGKNQKSISNNPGKDFYPIEIE
jgi:Tol biopolymer transport system component